MQKIYFLCLLCMFMAEDNVKASWAHYLISIPDASTFLITYHKYVNLYSESTSHVNWCTGALLNRIITSDWEGVGLARYEPALLPLCPAISNCQRSTHSICKWIFSNLAQRAQTSCVEQPAQPVGHSIGLSDCWRTKDLLYTVSSDTVYCLSGLLYGTKTNMVLW